MVPTVDTVRYDFLVYSLLQAKRPVLLTGPVGTGKTSLAQKVLQRLDPKIYSLLVINLSAQVGQKTDSSSVYLFMTPHKTKFNSFFCGVMSQLEQMYENDIWLTPKYLGALQNSKGKERVFAGVTSDENSLGETERTSNNFNLRLASLPGFQSDCCGVLLPLHQLFK